MPDPSEDDIQQPLIRSEPNNPPRVSYSSDSHDQDITGADESALGTPGIFIWALTFSAGVSGLLFGYE
jgi:SP family myo-inositol transporter-like MFS transporter 13